MKNKGGGNKSKKQGRKNYKKKTLSLDDLTKDVGQEYAFVQDKFGDGRFNVMCYDKVTRRATVRGSIRNSCRIQKGSLILVSLREFEEMKCDILYEYLPDDIEKLLSHNIIPESFIKSGRLNLEENEQSYSDVNFIQDIPDDTHPVNEQNTNNLDVWDDGWGSDTEEIGKEEKEERADAIQLTIIANQNEFTNNVSKKNNPKKVTYNISDDENDELNIDDI